VSGAGRLCRRYRLLQSAACSSPHGGNSDRMGVSLAAGKGCRRRRRRADGCSWPRGDGQLIVLGRKAFAMWAAAGGGAGLSWPPAVLSVGLTIDGRAIVLAMGRRNEVFKIDGERASP